MRLFFIIITFIIVVVPGRVLGQPVKGMVWEPPVNQARAEKDLADMRAIGVQAVRTPLLRDESLYELADSLGLVLYQDLSFDYLPAQALLDTLDYARQIVQEAAWWAEKHPSARYFGLSQHSDTSDQEACRFFEELVRLGRSLMPASTSFYYITSFVEDDQCAKTVDFVMKSALDAERPLDVVRRWEETHPDVPLALSALGVWVAPEGEEEGGYLREHSPAYQARYLETNLLDALEGPYSPDLNAVFVYRWRDRRLDVPSPANDLKHPYRHTYGIVNTRSVERPAYGVVSGIFSGAQRVFAFPAGAPKPAETPWITLLGWLNVALLAFGVSYFPRLRPTIQRYFGAHGFYREAVAEGRELLFGPNALLLTALMLAFGISVAVVLETVRASEAFFALVRWMPASLRETIILLLGNELVLLVVLACAYAVAVVMWTSILSAASARSRRLLLPGQAFMLVVWSQWMVLLLMPAALVVNTLTSGEAPRYAILLFVTLLLVMAAASIRTLRDYTKIIRGNLVQLAIAFWGNPFFLVLLVGIYLCFLHSDKFAYFWHLMTRS